MFTCDCRRIRPVNITCDKPYQGQIKLSRGDQKDITISSVPSDQIYDRLGLVEAVVPVLTL